MKPRRLVPLRLRAYCPRCGRPPLDDVEPWVRLHFRGVEPELIVRWTRCSYPGCGNRYPIRAGDYQLAAPKVA